MSLNTRKRWERLTPEARKAALNYRKSTDTATCCQTCKHCQFVRIENAVGQYVGNGWRCRVIGLGASKRHKIKTSCVCDAHESVPDQVSEHNEEEPES